MDAYGKDVKEGYFYFNDYLIKSAKKYNTLGDETTKNIYVSTSEQIIDERIKYLIKYEKNFLLFKDNINKLKNFLIYNHIFKHLFNHIFNYFLQNFQ